MRGFYHTRDREAGSAAVIAIFIVVVIGLIGSSLVSTLVATSTSLASSVQATQAYYVADAATEWAANRQAGSATPVLFGNGTFTVTSSAGVWVATGSVGTARRQIRSEVMTAVPSGLDYVVDSRNVTDKEFKFRVVNNQLASVTINRMRVSWDAPVAFFEKLAINVLGVKDYGDVWDYNKVGAVRWANGDLKSFTNDPFVPVPMYRTMEIKVKEYKTLQTGAAPRAVLTNTIMTIQFYNNDTQVGEVEVDLPLDE